MSYWELSDPLFNSVTGRLTFVRLDDSTGKFKACLFPTNAVPSTSIFLEPQDNDNFLKGRLKLDFDKILSYNEFELTDIMKKHFTQHKGHMKMRDRI